MIPYPSRLDQVLQQESNGQHQGNHSDDDVYHTQAHVSTSKDGVGSDDNALGAAKDRHGVVQVDGDLVQARRHGVCGILSIQLVE